MKLYLFLIILVFVFSGCDKLPKTQNLQPASTPTANPLPSYQKKISKTEFGENWAFAVDEGILECRNKEVVFIADGKTYAVNGTAKQSKRYIPIEEIWADDPNIKGIKKNIGFTIEKGLELCN